MTAQFAGTPSDIIHDWRGALKTHAVSVPCRGCVSCCRSGLLVKLTAEEAQRLPHETNEDGRLVLPHKGRDCALFDAEKNRCSIYESRPIACREYDCRSLWLAGLRNTHRGFEMNERLESWRTEVHSDLDLGIVAVVWMKARELLPKCDDVQLAAGAAVTMAMLMRREDLETIGRKARRGGVVNVLNRLNGQIPPEEARPA